MGKRQNERMRDIVSLIRCAPGVGHLSLSGGGMVLLHPNRRRLFLFNRSAHLLWRALRAGAGDCLSHILASRYGLPMPVAQRDADAIVARWIDDGLVSMDETLGESDRVDPTAALRPSDVTPYRAYQYFRVGKLVFGVSADAGFERAIAPLFSHLRVNADSSDVVCLAGKDGENGCFLVVDGQIIVERVELHVAIGAFYYTILQHLHPTARWRATIHAGAVAMNGVAAILAAPSGSGKSTLAAYLVTRDFEYLSDDLVPLRVEDNAVAPFPLPISVKPGAAPVLAPFYPLLDATASHGSQFLVGNADFLAPARRAKALIFPRWIAGAATRFEPLSVQQALELLLADRIHFGYPIEYETFSGFVRWLHGIARHELIYSELREAEHCIRQVLTT